MSYLDVEVQTSASGTKLLGILINVGTRHCLVPTFICQLTFSTVFI